MSQLSAGKDSTLTCGMGGRYRGGGEHHGYLEQAPTAQTFLRLMPVAEVVTETNTQLRMQMWVLFPVLRIGDQCWVACPSLHRALLAPAVNLQDAHHGVRSEELWCCLAPCSPSLPTSVPEPEGRLPSASCLSHVWHFGRCGIRVSGTQHAKHILCHVNLCAALCGRGSHGNLLGRFLGNLHMLPPSALRSFFLLGSPMIAGRMTYHPGTHPTYPGPSSLTPVLPFCLPLGAEEDVYGKSNLRAGAHTTEREARALVTP